RQRADRALPAVLDRARPVKHPARHRCRHTHSTSPQKLKESRSGGDTILCTRWFSMTASSMTAPSGGSMLLVVVLPGRHHGRLGLIGRELAQPDVAEAHFAAVVLEHDR